MKILLVGFKLAVGNELYMKMLCKHLKNNIEVKVCGDHSFIEKYDIGISIAKGGNGFQMFRDTLNIINYLKFAWVVKSYRPDFVFFVSSHPLNNVAILITRALSPRTKVISHIHDPIPHSGTKYGWVIWFSQFFQSKFSDILIVSGKKLKQDLVRTYMLKNKEIKILYLGAHREEKNNPLKKDFPDRERIYVSLLGRVERYKGIKNFLEAALIVVKKLRSYDKKVKFLIGGEGNLEKYKNLIEELPPSSLEIRNYRLTDDEFDDILIRSYACVLPYIDATQTGTIQIAYYNKCPVIVTNVGSLPELVRDGETGFIIEPSNSKALAEKILLLVQKEVLREKMGKSAYEFYLRNLRWSLIIKDLINYLSNLQENSLCSAKRRTENEVNHCYGRSRVHRK